MIPPSCGYCGTLRVRGICPRCATPAQIDSYFREVLTGRPPADEGLWQRFCRWLEGR